MPCVPSPPAGRPGFSSAPTTTPRLRSTSSPSFASCKLHGIKPDPYLAEVIRILPYLHRDRFLELAPALFRVVPNRRKKAKRPMGKRRSPGRSSTVAGEAELEIRSLYPSKGEWAAERKLGGVIFGLQIEVGVKGTVGADLFDVVVADLEGLRQHGVVDENGVIADRNVIVFRDFSWQALERVLETILRRCQAPTWDESVLKLQRYFRWEYEDFRRG